MRQAYKKANRFHRVDTLKTPQKPRRNVTQNYYQKERTGKRKKVLRIIWIIIAILLIQSIFQLPQLALSNIELHGFEHAPQDSITRDVEATLQQKRMFIFKNNNYILFKPGMLAEDLSNQYFLENVVIEKKFPSTVVVSGDERISPFVRQTPDAYYLLNYTGETLGQTNEAPNGTIIIADERQNIAETIPLKYLEQATDWLTAWEQRTAAVELNKLHLTDAGGQIIVSTTEDYRLVFTMEEDYALQLARLTAILEQDILPSEIEYIDLRFANNVYFK
jgi:cell division septal protein FtsQ